MAFPAELAQPPFEFRFFGGYNAGQFGLDEFVERPEFVDRHSLKIKFSHGFQFRISGLFGHICVYSSLDCTERVLV